jgi:hypothetical protein
MFYKIKICISIFILTIGPNVMLAPSQTSLGSLLLVNQPVPFFKADDGM